MLGELMLDDLWLQRGETARPYSSNGPGKMEARHPASQLSLPSSGTAPIYIWLIIAEKQHAG